MWLCRSCWIDNYGGASGGITGWDKLKVKAIQKCYGCSKEINCGKQE